MYIMVFLGDGFHARISYRRHNSAAGKLFVGNAEVPDP
jgi:hypothetical protein